MVFFLFSGGYTGLSVPSDRKNRISRVLIVIADSSNFQIKFKCYDPLHLFLLRFSPKIVLILCNVMLHAPCSMFRQMIYYYYNVDNDHLNFVLQQF